jgi:hypothetical protein
LYPPSALRIGISTDFQVNDFAADPLPLTYFALSQDDQDGFSFEPDPSLRLIIKRAV